MTAQKLARAVAAGSVVAALSWGAVGCRPSSETEGIAENDPAVVDPLTMPDVAVEDASPTRIRLQSNPSESPEPEPAGPEPAGPEPAGPEPAAPQPVEPTPAKPQPSGSPASLSPATAVAVASDRAEVEPGVVLPLVLRDEPPGDEIIGGSIKGPEDWRQWPKPDAVLVISGQQHGYIEPCGCTGLENQKGGLARRATLVKQIRELGWEAVPLDAGNQVRRSGRQAAIKFQATVKGLTEIGYQAIGFGPDDLRMGASELLSVAADDDDNPSRFASANVELLAPDLVPVVQIVEAGGQKIGVTAALHPETLDAPVDDAIVIGQLKEHLTSALEQLREKESEFKVLLLFGDADAAKQVARDVPGFDLIVAAATYGEPTYQADEIEGTTSRLVLTGDKGMYVGLVGIYDGAPMRYARVALTSDFEDAPKMLELMAEYQEQLKALGLEGLQVRPIPHPSGGEFVGTATCAECHTTAHEIWQGTPHAEATEHLVHPGERSDIPRHFDPECLSCHVTGWNPQSFYPYLTGYLSLEGTPHMTGSGCENCHGPGAAHAAAERSGSGLSATEIAALRESVRLPLENAKEKCMECHDLDNSPDFHKPGAFEEYWSQIEHYGVD